MPIVRARFFKIMFAAFAVVSPVMTHLVLIYTAFGHENPNVAYASIAIQLACICLAAKAFVVPPYRWLAIAGLVACTVAFCISHLSSGMAFTTGLPHAVTYFGLLVLFGASLLPGHEAIVTFFARKIHGHLSMPTLNYTRRVTYAWCFFFILQLLGSALLISFAPLGWWSAFVNLLNIPLVVFMFVGERLSRPLWLVDPPREYLPDVVHMIKLVTGKATQPVQSRS